MREHDPLDARRRAWRRYALEHATRLHTAIVKRRLERAYAAADCELDDDPDNPLTPFGASRVELVPEGPTGFRWLVVMRSSSYGLSLDGPGVTELVELATAHGATFEVTDGTVILTVDGTRVPVETVVS